MAEKAKQERRLWALYIVGALFIIILGLFLAGVLMDAISSGTSILMIAILLIPFACIVAVMAIFMKRRAEAVKSGLILKDEMTSRAEGRAGRYTSMLTIWMLIALMWYQGFGTETFGLPELAARHVIYITLFFTMGVFFGLRWYFMGKGNV